MRRVVRLLPVVVLMVTGCTSGGGQAASQGRSLSSPAASSVSSSSVVASPVSAAVTTVVRTVVVDSPTRSATSAPTSNPATTSSSTDSPVASAPPAEAVDARNYLGTEVVGPNAGSTVTVFDYRSPTDNEATGQIVAGIDVQVCVGQLPEGTSQVTWAPWSMVGEDNARYSTPAPAGGGDMGPQFPQVTRVASGDCVRGWITFEVPPDATVSTVRYILGEDAGNFSASFRPLPAPAPGKTRPEGCELISDPNDDSASGIWLKPYQDVRIEVRGSYPSPEDHGAYYVARTTAGTVLTWFWFDRLYIERLNGTDAKNLPYPADSATFAVAEDFMDNGEAYRPSINAAFETAKQCVS